MYSAVDTQLFTGWVPPFGYPRINARSQLPVAFRSQLRPSSPPDAKTSTMCPYYLDLFLPLLLFPYIVKERNL